MARRCSPVGWLVPCALVVGILFLLCLLGSVAEADVIYLKNKTTIDGAIKRETDTQVVIVTDAGTLYIDRADIERIERKRFEPVDVPKPQAPPQPQPAVERAEATPTPEQPGPRPTDKRELHFDALQELDLSPVNYWLRALLVTKSEIATEVGRDHVGYNHTVLAPLRDKSGYRLAVESVLLRYSRRLDSYLVMEVITNRRFEPIGYTIESLSPRSHIKVTGEKKGDGLVLTTITNEGTSLRTIEYPADSCMLDSSMYHLLAGDALSAGSKRQYKFFDLISGLKGVEQVEVVRAESVRALGRTFDTWVVKARILMLESPPIEVHRWMSQPTESRPAGRLLKVEVGEGAIVYQAATEAQATAGVKELVDALG
ncbi:MAG: hypothetical protein KAX80_11550, partial [Planctomycetes bacterium]|nr:hypothetical protein [Planctomycetota bacterium]